MKNPGWKRFFSKVRIIHLYTQLCRLLAYFLNSLRLRPDPNIEKALIKAITTSNRDGREKALALLSASVKANSSKVNQHFLHQLGHDIRDITALHLAVYHHDLQAIKILLEHGASALISDNDGYTAFHIAIQEAIKLHYRANKKDRKTMLDIIKKLIQDQPSVIDSRDGTLYKTALHMAAKAGDHEVALLLIDQGADVNCVDSVNNTPLHYTAMRLDNPKSQALHSGQLSIATALIEKGCNTKIKNRHDSQVGATALEEAIHTKNTAMIDLLSGLH